MSEGEQRLSPGWRAMLLWRLGGASGGPSGGAVAGVAMHLGSARFLGAQRCGGGWAVRNEE